MPQIAAPSVAKEGKKKSYRTLLTEILSEKLENEANMDGILSDATDKVIINIQSL